MHVLSVLKRMYQSVWGSPDNKKKVESENIPSQFQPASRLLRDKITALMLVLRNVFQFLRVSLKNTKNMKSIQLDAKKIPSEVELPIQYKRITLSDREIKLISRMYLHMTSSCHVYVSRTAVKLYLKRRQSKSRWALFTTGIPVVVWMPTLMAANLYVTEINSGLPLWSCELGKHTKYYLENDCLHAITTQNEFVRMTFHNQHSSFTTYGIINLMVTAVSVGERCQ